MLQREKCTLLVTLCTDNIADGFWEPLLALAGIKGLADTIKWDHRWGWNSDIVNLCSVFLKTKAGTYNLFVIKANSCPYFSGRNAKPGVLLKKTETDADVHTMLALVLVHQKSCAMWNTHAEILNEERGDDCIAFSTGRSKWVSEWLKLYLHVTLHEEQVCCKSRLTRL